MINFGLKQTSYSLKNSNINKPPLFEKEQPIEELCVEADEHVHWSSKTLESKCQIDPEEILREAEFC